MFFFFKNKNSEIKENLEILGENIKLDLFVSGREFINGIGESAKEKINSIYDEFSSELKKESLSFPQKYSFKEKNYGYGADWLVALVEFVAHNDWVGAMAKIGGLITLGKNIANFIKKHTDKSVFLGIKTARLISLWKISEKTEIKDAEILVEYHFNRGRMGFTEKEYLFVWGINRYNDRLQESFNKDREYLGVIYTVCIDWKGNVKSVNQF